MRRILSLVLLAIVLVPAVSAQTLHTTCDDGVYYERMYNGSTILLNNTFTCENGCALNGLECDLPATPDIFMPIGIALIITAFLFFYMAYKIESNEHWPLQFMFIIFALLYIMYDAYVLSQFAFITLNQLSSLIFLGVNLGIWTIFFFFLYFFYLMFRWILDILSEKKKKGTPVKWF